MEDSVFALIYRRLDERRQMLADHITSGAPGDYVAYVRAQAMHAACVEITEDVKELESRFMEQ